jgi:quercetin dioxygenase-like cupin family protein
MRRRIAIAGGFAGLVLIAGVAAIVARGTPPTGQTIDSLAKGTTADSYVLAAKGMIPSTKERAWRGTYKTPWDVTSLRVSLPPGANTGWHRHPGPGFAVVTQGSVTMYSDDCTPMTYTKGQAYVEIPGLVNLVQNNGPEPAQFLVTFIVPSPAPLRMDVASAPCNPVATVAELHIDLPDGTPPGDW